MLLSFLWCAVALPPPLALLHAMAVGVFLTTAMGLLYQFVPVVSMTTLRHTSLPFVHLAMAATGTVLLVFGFTVANFAYVAYGGAFHGLGMLLETAILIDTARYGKPPAPARGAGVAFVWLFATIGAGTWMALRLSRGEDVVRFANIHAVLGLAGFFGTLIVAMSFRMLRMFERVDREGHAVPWALAIGIASLVTMLVQNGAWLLVATGAAFGIDLASIGRARSPAYQRETFAYAIASAAGGIAATLCYAFHDGFHAVLIAVWFFVGTAVVGYLQRIVPFIWWIHRAKRDGPRSVPALAKMNESRLGYAVLVAWLSAGICYIVTPYTPLGPDVAVVAWLLLIAQLIRPFILKQTAPMNPHPTSGIT